MSQILYYPHYTPSTSHLRTLLLFYDEVSSLVPTVDSQNVLAREDIYEVNDRFGRFTYKTIDTSGKFHAWAAEDTLALNEFMTLFELQKEEGKKLEASDFQILKEDSHLSERRNKIIFSYIRKGFRLVAAQKIPFQLMTDMEESSLAISLNSVILDGNGRTVEENPILMSGPLANFFLSRMAREVAGETGLQTMTFDQNSYTSHTLNDGAARARLAGEIALNITLPIIVPPKIEALNIGYFSELRDEYRTTRERLNTVAESLSVRMGLNTAPNERIFLERVRDARADFVNAMQRTEQTMRQETYRKMFNGSFTVGATIAGAGIGLAFTNDNIGTLIGAGAGAFLSLLAPKQSTMVHDDYNGLAKQAVMARGKISSKLAAQKRVQQHYPYI